MTKHRVISFNSNKTFLRIFVGFIASVVVLMCLALSQDVFAGQSDISGQSTLPPTLPVFTGQVAFSDLREQELIQSLMTDMSEMEYDKKNSDDSWQAVRMRVTAYCPCSQCCGEYSDGITACNHRIEDGDRFVAADNMYAFGTEMIIPGYNEGQSVEVKDRGGAIKNNKLDVFFNTHEEALAWGVHNLYVLIKVQ